VMFHNRFVSPEEMVELSAPRTFTSRLTGMKRRWFPARLPTHWGGQGDHLDSLLARYRITRRRAAHWCPSKIPRLSPARPSNCWILPPSATPCVNAPICSDGDDLERAAQGYMEALIGFAATAWKIRAFSFGARYPQNAQSAAGIETGSCQRPDR